MGGDATPASQILVGGGEGLVRVVEVGYQARSTEVFVGVSAESNAVFWVEVVPRDRHVFSPVPVIALGFKMTIHFEQPSFTG